MSDAGAVNVLYGSGGGLQATSPDDQFWTQNSPGVRGTAKYNDQFGKSVAAGDFNHDGFADLAIGVAYEWVPVPGGITFGGAVQVLYGSAGGLQATAPMTGSGIRTAQVFGGRPAMTRHSERPSESATSTKTASATSPWTSCRRPWVGRGPPGPSKSSTGRPGAFRLPPPTIALDPEQPRGPGYGRGRGPFWVFHWTG